MIKKFFSSYQGLPTICWLGIGLSFMESTLASIYYFLSIYFVDNLKINISITGIMISFYGLGTIAGGFIGGKLSDKLSPQSVSIISLLVQALIFFFLIKLKLPVFISIVLFFLGMAAYSFITSNYVFVLNACENNEAERLKAINALNVVSNLGVGIASLIIGGIGLNHFQNLFQFSAICLLIIALLLMFNQTGFKEVSIPTFDNDNNLKSTAVSKQNNNKIILLALVSLFFTGLTVSQLSTTYSIYLKESLPDLGVHAFSLFFFLNTFLVVIFQNYLVNKFKDNNKLLMMGISSFLIGFGMFLLIFPSYLLMIILSCVIYSAGEMIFFSIVQLFCYQRGAENKKGSSLGTYRMVYASSRFVGPTVGGSIYYYWGGSTTWCISGLIGFILFFVCYYFRKLA